jgi:hypothetical protein
MSHLRIVVVGVALLGCGVDTPRRPPAPTLAGDTEGGSTGDGSVDEPTTGISAGSDGVSTTDASTSGASSSASPTTASTTAASDTSSPPPESSTSSGGDATGGTTSSIPAELDPDLDIAGVGQPCATPGFSGDCPFLQVCRFYDTQIGRCETCENCGNLNAPCTDGTECDILFACFAGRCTNFCWLGEQECGAPDDCLDVGHPTRGVCDPYAG